MEQLKINHAAVWVSIMLMFGLGFLWFARLFREKWMELNGLDMSALTISGVVPEAWRKYA